MSAFNIYEDIVMPTGDQRRIEVSATDSFFRIVIGGIDVTENLAWSTVNDLESLSTLLADITVREFRCVVVLLGKAYLMHNTLF